MQTVQIYVNIVLICLILSFLISFSSSLLFLSVLPLCAAGMHRAKEGHREDVCHEVHEQTAVHRER